MINPTPVGAGLSHVAVAVVSHRGVATRTTALLSQLQGAGARVLVRDGMSDLSLARNLTMTEVCAVVRKEGQRVVLLVDDDMVWDIGTVERLCRTFDDQQLKARSAVYATGDSRVAATRIAVQPDVWLTGLGLFAVDAESLLTLGARLGAVRGPHGKPVVPFCVAGPYNGRWVSEDYCLGLRLGGVQLDHTCPAGHIKPVPLWPDEDTLARIGAGLALPKTEQEHGED